MKNNRGFTLIEILVVVVILAILAALVLPRFFEQSARAEITEAQEMLGALRRAQITYKDVTGGSYQDVDGTAQDADLKIIGMQAIPGEAKYNYACVAADSECTATHKVTAANKITISIDTGAFGCEGGYAAVDAGDASKGCRPS